MHAQGTLLSASCLYEGWDYVMCSDRVHRPTISTWIPAQGRVGSPHPENPWKVQQKGYYAICSGEESNGWMQWYVRRSSVTCCHL